MILYDSSYYGIVKIPYSSILAHHGAKGMHWHQRRWQNEDGSLTPAGRIHYGVGEGRNKAKTDMRSDNEVSEAEKLVVRARTSTKPITKYNPKSTDSFTDIVYEASRAALSGKSAYEVEKQLKATGLPQVTRKMLLQAFEKGGSFNDYSIEDRASKINELDKRYSKAKGEDYVVSKGKETQRFTTSSNEEIGDERKYVSVTDKDKQIYKDFYPTNLREFGRMSSYGGIIDKLKAPDRVFETKLSTIKDLKVAGAKAYDSAFMELYNNPEIRAREGWEKTEKGKLYTKIFGKKVAELQARDIKNARDKFDLELQYRDKETNKQFLKSLRDKGYDAVEDQFSRKVDNTEGNLIVLDPKSSLKRTSVKEVKFDEHSNYAGTVSKKQGDKAYAEEVKKSAALRSDLSNALSKSNIDKDGMDLGVAIDKSNDKQLKEIQKKYGLTGDQLVVSMLTVADEIATKKRK